MSRQLNKLTVRGVKTLNSEGYYGDGGGLYLQISRFSTKSWVYRFRLNGRNREMGLGPFPDVTLQKARGLAENCRAMVREGQDPIEARKLDRARANLEFETAVTFKKVADDYIAQNEAGWSNRKHGQQWSNTLGTYAYPLIGGLPVSLIDTHHITKILEPIWVTKNETARRVRGRIESVLDAARVKGLRTGENPARWKGHLDKLFPAASKVSSVKHHPALPYPHMGAFMERLRDRDGAAASGLEFLILTAARTGEVIGARWSEVDMQRARWVLPADRMKGRREHSVPLSEPALAVLHRLALIRSNEFVFPGRSGGLSNMAFAALLKRMDYTQITAHGFRSTFRDWAAETTAHPSDVVEMALAHSIGNKAEAAYRRGDLFEKRRRLMGDWAGYCARRDAGLGDVRPLFEAGS